MPPLLQSPGGHEDAALVTLPVQEHLVDGMLVCDPGGRHWHDALAVLAQALGPELGEPGAIGGPLRHIAEKHQLAVAVALQGVGPAGQMEGGMPGKAGRILGQRAGHSGRPVQQGLPVDTQKGGGQQAHGRKGRIAAAQIVRNFQRIQSVAGGLLAQETLVQVRDHDHVLVPALAQGLAQPVPAKEVLGKGLDGAAGLADADHRGLVGRQLGQPALEGGGADVVRDPEAGAVMAGTVLPGRKGALQGAGPQCGAADAQHQHMAPRTDPGQQGRQFPLQALPVRHGQERQRALRAFRLQTARQLRRTRGENGGSVPLQTTGIGAGPFKRMHHGVLPLDGASSAREAKRTGRAGKRPGAAPR